MITRLNFKKPKGKKKNRPLKIVSAFTFPKKKKPLYISNLGLVTNKF